MQLEKYVIKIYNFLTNLIRLTFQTVTQQSSFKMIFLF